MLYTAEWKIAADGIVFSGKAVIEAIDAIEAERRVREELGGKEGNAASVTVNDVGGDVFWLKRREKIEGSKVNYGVQQKTEQMEYSTDVYVFELAIRANVIASTERAAFAKLSTAVRNRESDQYVKFYKDAVLEKEKFSMMSEYERNMLHKGFVRFVRG